MARRMTDSGVLTIFSFASPLRADRSVVRDTVGADRFIEVHVATSLDLCRERDTRGNYDTAHAPPSYEAPREPDVSIALDDMSVEDAAKAVVRAITARGLLDDA
jgi:adenylylsulfate kinase-like enzyme